MTTTTQITPPAIHQKVTQLLALLSTAKAVDVDSPLLSEWGTEAPNGDPENQILMFTWVDDEGLNFSCILTEGGIAEGNWSGNSFFCNDHEGDPVQMTMYRLEPIVPSQT